ncbi:MAG: family 1 glycosylhydrolase [SAR324 cluster bacterium]|uniref:Family 1 glycosylhydrolase n=1 Tax=SAR324 cluster bacterium TaxID=2024889 RepID=A0A7X9FTK5_9DELT|nr:family 1 glycosylhydrolase [SAR324 cluster bacterium]
MAWPLILPGDRKSKVVNNSRRIEYLKDHIKEVRDAIHRGVLIEGYFLWTLMDNFEKCQGDKPDSCFALESHILIERL